MCEICSLVTENGVDVEEDTVDKIGDGGIIVSAIGKLVCAGRIHGFVV